LRPFALRGRVVRGDGLGRLLGFPTANLRVAPARIPPFGVYRVSARPAGLGLFAAVCSVGRRATIGAGKSPCVEVHIPGFSGDLYGRTLSVVFFEKLRNQKRFASLEALQSQIRRDVRQALAKGGPALRRPSPG